jgi:hypothetical protein
MNSRNKRKSPTSKYLRLWNLCSKLDLVITFWAILLIISFKDHILIFNIWLPNTTIEGAIRAISHINFTLLPHLGVWPKQLCFSVPEHLSIYLTVLARTDKSLLRVELPKSKCATKSPSSQRVSGCQKKTELILSKSSWQNVKINNHYHKNLETWRSLVFKDQQLIDQRKKRKITPVHGTCMNS